MNQNGCLDVPALRPAVMALHVALPVSRSTYALTHVTLAGLWSPGLQVNNDGRATDRSHFPPHSLLQVTDVSPEMNWFCSLFLTPDKGNV
jgi:hypothetical protein